MKKLSAVLMLVLVSAFAPQVMATIISGNHTTDGGKIVALQGLEWLSFDASGGHDDNIGSNYTQKSIYNRNDIEAGQGGFINNTPDTWRYATRTETENLLDSLWGGIAEAYDPTNLDGAAWFLKNIAGFNPVPSASGSRFHFGDLTGGDSYRGGVALIGSNYDPTSLQNTGLFRDNAGLSTGTDLVNEQYYSSKDRYFNHLLVRQANVSPVPVPGAAWLMGTGIMGLVAKRKLV